MKKFISFLFVPILLFALAGCYPSPSNPTTSTSDTTTNTAQANNVVIQNFAFNPTPLTITLNSSVTWTNQDVVPHTVTFADTDSSILDQGKTYTRTFETAGTFDYHCQIHPSMHGQIIVR